MISKDGCHLVQKAALIASTALCLSAFAQWSDSGSYLATTDYRDILVKGPAWGASGNEAAVKMGDANHSIKARWGYGVSISTNGASNALVLNESTGNVGIGIGLATASKKLHLRGEMLIDDDSPSGWQSGSKAVLSIGDASSFLQNEWGDVMKISTNNPLRIETTNNTNIFLMPYNGAGSVGINKIDPGEKLDVNGKIRCNQYVSTDSNVETVSGQYSASKLVYAFSEGRGWGYNKADNRIYAAMNEVTAMVIGNDGGVGIGTTNPDTFKLAVNGTIKAKGIVVSNTGWSDFVFKKGYNLKPIAEVEKFIKTNKHLEGIPTEKEVAKNGVSVGDMQAKLIDPGCI